MSENELHYDVVVIGAGPAGENAAAQATGHGLTAAIVESELVGGECSYWACMPSKALLRATEAVAAARRAPGAREAVTGDVDVAQVFARRNAFTGDWDDAGQVPWLADNDIALHRGHGRLAGVRTVEVTATDGTVTTLRADRAVVIATGSAAAFPPVPGLRESEPWGNREITALQDVPRRLVVLGGGVVGSEMAQAWKRLGAEEVTLVELAPRLLPTQEPEVGEHLRRVFESEGITVHVGTGAERVERNDAGEVVLTAGDVTVVADEILVATGRRPLTEDIGLDTVGIEPGGYLTVDDQLRVVGDHGDWLYAIGDVNGRALVTHQGKYQARIAGDVIAGLDGDAWADHTAVPGVVFTDPHVASVGLTTEHARARGLDVRTVDHSPAWTAGAAALGEGIEGFGRLVIDNARDVIVGATFVGPGVGEMIHAATIAIVGEVTLDRLWHAVPAFPTMSEVWLRFLETDRDATRTPAAA